MLCRKTAMDSVLQHLEALLPFTCTVQGIRQTGDPNMSISEEKVTLFSAEHSSSLVSVRTPSKPLPIDSPQFVDEL